LSVAEDCLAVIGRRPYSARIHIPPLIQTVESHGL
jgi:hypothetical protein